MKKDENSPLKFDSLTDIHRAFGLPKPLHPLIGLINGAADQSGVARPPGSHVLTFYKISYKAKLSGKMKYGQDYYDFDEGGLLFAAPGQVVGGYDSGDVKDCSLYTLLIHPDFLLRYPLA